MKRNNIDLIFPAIGIFIIARSFMNDATTTDFFGTEISIWLYRGIWLVMILVGFYRYFKSGGTQNKM